MPGLHGLLRRLPGRSPVPRVSVVVWTPDDAGSTDECLASIRASLGVATEVVKVAETASLDRAVELATGEYVGFLSADDVLPPDGLATLVEALSTGADGAVGHRQRHRVGKLMPLPPAGAPTDLVLSGKLFRLSCWRATGASIGSWAAQARAVARVLGTADVVVVPEVVCDEHERDTSAPVNEQRRFRADLARTRFAALSEVVQASTEPTRAGAAPDQSLPLDALEHLLPDACRDAVGGGPAYFSALQPFAREVVDGVAPGRAASVPVAARLVSWVAAHGSLTDVALTLDHLADNPHGLPGTEQLTDPPPGLSVPLPDEWRAIGPGDRRLRSRVLDLQPLGRDRVRLVGNAFIENVAFVEPGPGQLPEVHVSAGGNTLDVSVGGHADERANEWAARDWEDRRESGFQAEIARADLPPARSGTWSVRVSLGGHDAEHQVRMLRVAPSPDPVVDAIALGADAVLVRGTGAPARLRLHGRRGTTPWVDVRPWADGHVEGRFEATLSLRTSFLDEQTLLPGGRYRIEAEDARERSIPVTLSAGLLACPPDLVGARLGLRLGEDRDAEDAAVLVVGRPMTAEDRSAFGHRQRINAYAVRRQTSTATVLLESFHGRFVGDNPAAIGRELAGRGLPLDLAWVVDDPGVNVPEGARAVPYRTQAWVDALADAHGYVANAAAPTWFRKADGQFHLQTWHGTPLKKIGEDRGPGDFNTWRHRRHIAGQSASWDAMISPSPYCTEIFRSAFRYDGPMLEIGYPRNDVLVCAEGPQLRARTRHRLGLTDHDRVLLYAPTWREYLGVHEAKPLFLDPVQLLAELPDAVVLVRGHYNATRQPDVFPDRPRIIDVTRYPDVAELYLAADWLVTDYSSVMFDFALTDKPMVLLTPDLDRYRDVERGFYFDIETDPPGPMVGTTGEVMERLSGPDEHAGARARFRERFCPYDDGHAAARAVDHLLASW
ncbi:MAG: CDP-glycerol glycerophosphotransferase family protein [Marmoricola sp.]